MAENNGNKNKNNTNDNLKSSQQLNDQFFGLFQNEPLSRDELFMMFGFGENDPSLSPEEVEQKLQTAIASGIESGVLEQVDGNYYIPVDQLRIALEEIRNRGVIVKGDSVVANQAKQNKTNDIENGEKSIGDFKS